MVMVTAHGRKTAGATVLETTVRDWLPLLVPLAASLSALFAGLVCWMRRKRLSSRFEMTVIPRNNPKVVAVSIRVINRSDERLVIEAISVRRPLGILVNNTSGAHLAEMAGQEALQQATTALQTSYRREVETEQSARRTMLIHHDNACRSCKTDSVTLPSLDTFPVIRP